MDIYKCIRDGIGSGAVGLGVGMVLWIPSCVVGTIVSTTKSQGENVADRIFWICILGGALIGFLVSLSEEQKKDTEKERAEQELLRHEEKVRIAAQQSYQTELVTVSDLSLQSFEALPGHLLDAESILDRAEQDFKEEAFAPFWDSIEQATLRLGRFDGGVTSINHNLKRYGELSRVYKANPPRFPINLDSVKGMVAGATTADRLKVIVRQAQRNFQFASIYEQRRTNQILIAGFTNLAEAFDGMGRRISESIDGLSTQVSEMYTSYNEVMSSLVEKMVAVNQSTVAVSESIQGLRKEQSQRHERALDMLDNIQRRRMPTGFHVKDIGTMPAP